MVDFNELLAGSSIGPYTLERPVREDGGGAFFAVLTNGGERLLLKLAARDGSEEEQQFAAWQRSRLLRHPNLLDIRDTGTAELGGRDYIYAVFEYPDDILATAIEQGPVSEQEARGVLEAALAGLRYLHSQGMVHGAVDAAHIVAVGESIKLASDGLHESGDLEGHAEDVRQLGELVRALRPPEALDGTLASIVRHATAADPHERWTLAEIAAALEPTPAVAPPLPEAVPRIVKPVPVVHTPAKRLEQPLREGFPKWILAGVGVLLLLIVMLNLRRKPEAVPITPTAPAPVPTQPPAPAPVRPVAPPPRLAASASPVSAAIWRVIAFTYRSHDSAAKKVKQINARWPDLRAGVFTPKGLRGYYLVALGNRMDHDDAARLQKRARRLGLPRDTYVQNYDE